MVSLTAEGEIHCCAVGQIVKGALYIACFRSRIAHHHQAGSQDWGVVQGEIYGIARACETRSRQRHISPSAVAGAEGGGYRTGEFNVEGALVRVIAGKVQGRGLHAAAGREKAHGEGGRVAHCYCGSRAGDDAEVIRIGAVKGDAQTGHIGGSKTLHGEGALDHAPGEGRGAKVDAGTAIGQVVGGWLFHRDLGKTSRAAQCDVEEVLDRVIAGEVQGSALCSGAGGDKAHREGGGVARGEHGSGVEGGAEVALIGAIEGKAEAGQLAEAVISHGEGELDRFPDGNRGAEVDAGAASGQVDAEGLFHCDAGRGEIECQAARRIRGEGEGGIAVEHSALVHGHGDIALCGGSVAELAGAVLAPGGEGAVRAECQAVRITPSEGDDGLAEEHAALGHGHWNVSPRPGTVADLAVVVIPPSGERAIGAECQAVITTGCEGDDALAREWRPRRGHGHGDAAISAGTVAQRTEAIPAPCGQGAVGAERQAVRITRGDGDDGLAGEHPTLGHIHGDAASGSGTVAERAEAVVAPGDHGAVGAQRQAVRITRGDGDDGLAKEHPTMGHRHGDGGQCDGPVAEPAIAVIAPGGEGAVGAECDVVKCPPAEGDDGLTEEHPALVHSHRDVASRGGTVAELAVVVRAPGGEGAVGAERDAVISACGEGHDGLARKRSGLGHCRRDDLVIAPAGETGVPPK